MKELFRRRLFSAGIASLGIKFSHAIIAFLVTAVLARVLGPAGYGVYSFALALIMLTAIPAQAGIPQLMVRETAKSSSLNDWGLLRGLWRWSNLAVLGFSLLAVGIVGVVTLVAGDEMNSERLVTLQAGLLLIPLIALAKVRSAALRGLHYVIRGQLPDTILRPVLHLLLVLAVAVSGYSLAAEQVMWLHVAAAFVAFVVGAALLARLKPAEARRGATAEYHSREWASAVVPLGLLASFQIANNYADVLILGIFRSDEEVGIYRAVFQMGLLVLFGLQSINQVLQPYLARYYSTGKLERLQVMVSRAALAIFGFASLGVLFLFLFGELILAGVFGEAYVSGYLPLMIIALGFWAKSFSGPSAQLLKMAGYEKLAMKAALFAIVLNVVLNLVFVPPFGMTGAAGASAASLTIWHLLLKVQCKRILKINASASGFFTR